MSDGQPRQVQCKFGDVDADGNWQLGSPAPASATDDTTQTVNVTGHKRRAPTPAAAPFSAGNLKAAARHNAAAKKKKKTKPVKSKPVGQGEQPVSNAEERIRSRRIAAKPNVNPATPVAQHVPLASIKSESPPGSKPPMALTTTRSISPARCVASAATAR